MEALRNIYTVKDKKITIEIPENFNYDSVEVIILPLKKVIKTKEKELNNLLSSNETDENKSISLAGKLSNYAKPELIEKETDLAWSGINDD